MNIAVVARNTFRENIRDRVLYNLILFALVMTVSSIALGQLTLGYERKVIVDLGLSAISIFGTLIAIFIGIGLVHKELERRTVYALLSKPVRRHEFILGKYLGLLATLSVNVAVMTVGLWLSMLYQGGIEPAGYARILPAVYLIFLSLALTTALALVFSTFSTPALSALFTLFLWIAGHFNYDLLEFAATSRTAAMRRFFQALYYLVPNFSNFTSIDSRNVIQSAAYAQPVDWTAVGWITVYGLVYSGALLALAVAVFSRRDFK
jgi:ABC-type transport system involved in multi-copper enzyme maturation permease subunit